MGDMGDGVCIISLPLGCNMLYTLEIEYRYCRTVEVLPQPTIAVVECNGGEGNVRCCK